MLAGTGLLWIGWTGFNGGGPFAVSTDASLAILNTHVCTATSHLTWIILDTSFFGKASVIGAVQGMITGLVCITPAAAILMGLISGSIPWYTMMVLHKKVSVLGQVDDPMAVFHTHAIAGSLGGILTGFFAVPKLCRLFYTVPDWEKFIVPLRLDDDELQIGDNAIHGEEAFGLQAQRERFVNSKTNSVFDAQEFLSTTSRSTSELQMVVNSLRRIRSSLLPALPFQTAISSGQSNGSSHLF
ncbi:hypothetical protein FH972_006430 [Carpinus fangiana]|uniref:Ammonium transporter AmtB-like domain-containing protein n=1 Tax=Carpinus fangiana TaxID=176857 RepID=A0A5N6QVR7_9ROSI|nr:hypothetical protein FH972_006430 [Carpinus fangiana]